MTNCVTFIERVNKCSLLNSLSFIAEMFGKQSKYSNTHEFSQNWTHCTYIPKHSQNLEIMLPVVNRVTDMKRVMVI